MQKPVLTEAVAMEGAGITVDEQNIQCSLFNSK